MTSTSDTSFNIMNWSQLPRTWIVENAIARAGIRSDDALLTFNFVVPNAEAQPPHHHPFDQITIVIEGEMMLEVDGKSQRMGRGDMAHIPASAPHTAWPVGDKELLVIDVFAPVRKDYVFLTSHQKEFALDQ